MNKLGIIFQKTIIFLFNLLLIATPFVFTWINEELFEFNKMLFTYAVTTLIVCAWICRMFAEKKILFKKTIFDIPIFLFLISQIVSTIYSIHPRTSILGYYTRFNGGLLSTLSYAALFYAFINNFEKKHLGSIIKTLLVGGILVSLYAIPEHFGVSPSCIMISQEANVDCWKQDVQNRVFASFGQPNWLAAYLITLIPLAISMYINEKNKNAENPVLSNFYLIAIALMYSSLLFTKSRSGFIGMAGALILIALTLIIFGANLLKNKKNQSEAKQTFQPLVIIAALILIISAIFGTPYSPKLISFKKQEITSTAPAMEQTLLPSGKTAGGTDSGDIRKIVWKGAIDVWKRYPWVGSGVETFAYSYYLDRPIEHNLVSEWDFLYNKAHNELLNILATTGLFGLLSYLSIFVMLAVLFWQGLQKNNQHQTNLLSLGLVAGLLALSISNFFGFSTVMVQILLFTYLAFFCLINEYTEKDGLETKKNNRVGKKIRSSKTNSRISPFIIAPVIMSFFILRSIYQTWAADLDYAVGKSLIKSGQYLTGAKQIQKAVLKSPAEALYFDELSYAYAKLAVQFDQMGQSTESAELAETAIKTSDYVIALNDQQLNFYKTRARLFISLAETNADYLQPAKETLEQGLMLAPTDAKLMYYLGLVNLGMKNTEEGIANLEVAIEMKPNYLEARNELAKELVGIGNLKAASEQYQYILDNIVDDELVRKKLEIVEASMEAELK